VDAFGNQLTIVSIIVTVLGIIIGVIGIVGVKSYLINKARIVKQTQKSGREGITIQSGRDTNI